MLHLTAFNFDFASICIVFSIKAAILFHLGTLFLVFDRAAVDLHGLYHGSTQLIIFFAELRHTPLVVLFKSLRESVRQSGLRRDRNEPA